VEKLVKYIGLSNEVIKKEDLFKKVGHNTTLIFKRAIKEHQTQINLDEGFDVDKEFLEIKNFIDNNSTNIVVNYVISEINSTLKSNPKLPFDVNALKTSGDFYEVLKKFAPDTPDLELLKNIPNDQEFRTRLNTFIKGFTRNLPEYIKAIVVLFIINCLISSHVTTVRYPEIDNMVNPSDKYTKKNQLVNSIPFFHKTIKYCLAKIAKFEI